MAKKFELFLEEFFPQKLSNCHLCYTLAKVEIRASTQSRFKNQTVDSFKLLGYNCNHQQGFVKQQNFTIHCCGLNLKLPKHFYCNCWVNNQVNSCYRKIEQYWVKWLCAHIIMLFDYETFRALLCMTLSQVFLIVTCYTFCKLKIRTLTLNSFKNQTNQFKITWPQWQSSKWDWSTGLDKFNICVHWFSCT